jgi:hypothetical protein
VKPAAAQTPAGANVGSMNYTQYILGENVRTAVRDAGDGVLIAQSVTIIDGDKWQTLNPIELLPS